MLYFKGTAHLKIFFSTQDPPHPTRDKRARLEHTQDCTLNTKTKTGEISALHPRLDKTMSTKTRINTTKVKEP